MPDMHLLTGAYALDALDDVERAGFERHLRSCGTCAAEVIELQEAAAGLAGRVAMKPPESLRAKVMADVARTRQVSPSERVPLRRPPLRRMLTTAAAAVVIAGTAALGGVAWESRQSANDLEQVVAQAAEVNRVLTDPGRSEAAGPVSIGGTATVFAAQGKAVLAADRLPAPPSGRTYQVWVINNAAKASPAGFLDPTDGRGQSLVSGVSSGDSVAITEEPAGGSKQPTTDPIVSIKVV